MLELNKETAIQNEQQLNATDDIQIILNIESHLKSITDSLAKIANYWVITNPSGFYLK